MARKNHRKIPYRWYDHSYSTAYARTTGVWQTRRGRRNREFSSFPNLLGLNTASDDLHRKEGESPYLRNVRYMGEKQINQTAQVTSRAGQRLLHSIGDVKTVYPQSDAQAYLEMWEGKVIEFDVMQTKLLVGGGLYIDNIENAKGALRVLIKEDSETRPLCDAIIDLEKVPQGNYVRRDFRWIQGIEGDVTIRLEIIDDVDMEDCQRSKPIKGRKIRILSTGAENHREAFAELPNVSKCLKEQQTEFEDAPSIPLFSTITNDYKTLPRGIKVCCNGKDFLIYPVEHDDGTIHLYRERLPSNGTFCEFDTSRCADEYVKKAKPIKMDAPISSDSCAVRFSEAGGYVYYVDGHSPLQRFKLCDWKSEVVCPEEKDIDVVDTNGENQPNDPSQPYYVDPATLKPKEGASLILNLRNRLYLSGFCDDPNFVEVSLIDSTGPRFDQFNDGFYSPDQAPGDTDCNEGDCGAITALEQLENNLVVFRSDGNSVYSSNGGLLFGAPQQVDTFSWDTGTPDQESVTHLNGNLYFWNRSEGLRRFAGTDTSFRSIEIDNELRRIGPNDRVFLLGHANKVRFWFDRERRGYSDHCGVYHTFLSRSSPWYMDNQSPVMWAVGDQDSDTIYAMHSQYPATFIVDYTERNDVQFTDFNSSIPMEYSTNYISPGGMSGHTQLRRVILKIIANSTNSWFIGVDKDHQDNPSVWRKFVQAQIDTDENDDSVFGNTASAGSKTINLHMNSRCRDFQVRTLVYCYRSQAELMYIEAQVGSKDAL